MPFPSLFSWWRKPALGHLLVQMYTRQGCHLCAVAREQLQAAQRRHRFRLSIVDVDTDSELAARYGDEVPVVMVDGKVRFHGRVNEVLLNRLLRAEAARKTL